MTEDLQANVNSVEQLKVILGQFDLACGFALSLRTETAQGEDENEAFVKIIAQVGDRDTGDPTEIAKVCRFFLPERIDVILNRIRDAAEELMKHEMKERTYYRKRRIFDPHK